MRSPWAADGALFHASAASALLFHALLLLSTDGVHGGGDLKPHLRLIQLMAEEPALRSVYAPAYHVLGALLSPLAGLAGYAELFAWLSAAAFIASFRAFQRAADLPDACSALFAWMPYTFALTVCLPKIEVAGYALALLGLTALLRARPAWIAACLVAAFTVHTAAALFLGLCGGVLALARADRKALGALAAGTAVAALLPLAHVLDGCTWPQALLFSQDDYLRAAPRAHHLEHADRVLLLANPPLLVAALAGAGALWRGHRSIAWLCATIAVLYLNEVWLAPFGMRTTLDLMRGLTVLAIPVAVAAGLAVRHHPRAAGALVVGGALLAVGTTFAVVPDACVSKPVAVAEVDRFDVDRCMFRWRYAKGARP